MEIDEIEPHQLLFAVATLSVVIIAELLSYLMKEVIFDIIVNDLLVLITFFILFSLYWIILIPRILLAICFFLAELTLKPNYRTSEGKKLGKGNFYLTALPIISFLLAKNLSEFIGNLYLMVVIAPVIFIFVFYFYKKIEELL